MKSPLQCVSMNGFGIEPSVHDERLIVGLTGTADVAAIPPLRACLAEVPSEMSRLGLDTLEIDFRRLCFLNSACLKAFVAFVHRIHEDGPPLRIRFVVDANLGWQYRAFTALERMAPTTVTIDVR